MPLKVSKNSEIKLYAYISYKHVRDTKFREKVVFYFSFTKKRNFCDIYRTCIVHTFVFFYIGQVKSFFSTKLLAHTQDVQMYEHTFFSEFLNISKMVFQSRCKCPHVHLAIIRLHFSFLLEEQASSVPTAAIIPHSTNVGYSFSLTLNI